MFTEGPVLTMALLAPPPPSRAQHRCASDAACWLMSHVASTRCDSRIDGAGADDEEDDDDEEEEDEDEEEV